MGSNLLVLVIYLKLPRLRSPARLLLLHVSLGDLLPSVLQAALAFAFPLRGSRVRGGTTIGEWDGEWASAAVCEVSGRGGPPSPSCSRPRPLPLRDVSLAAGLPCGHLPTDLYSSDLPSSPA